MSWARLRGRMDGWGQKAARSLNLGYIAVINECAADHRSKNGQGDEYTWEDEVYGNTVVENPLHGVPGVHGRG